MENWKKFILVLTIFLFVIFLDLFLYFKTDKLIFETQNLLSTLKENLSSEDFEESKKDIKKLQNNWEKNNKILSLFIEHDELEKVSTKVEVIKENATNGEYENALEDIVEAKYILEHIKDKYNFSLKNIF